MQGKFIILDFGSQYTWLAARCFREMGYFSEVKPYDEPIDQLKKENPLGFILSGGPRSVFEPHAPRRSAAELIETAPCLGICYGMHLICSDLGGKVKAGSKGSYGASQIYWKTRLVEGITNQKVWMSHGDVVQEAPQGMELLAVSSQGIPSAFRAERVWAFQFHPEVHHTENGKALLKAFAEDMCRARPGAWTKDSMKHECRSYVEKTLKRDEKVLCALSGGVDSTVTAVLLTEILGKDRVHCLFVDTGLLRKNEFQEVLKSYQEIGLNVQGVSAEKEFLENLKGVTDPEKKRKVIGRTFIDIFKKYKKPEVEWLAQGTLYPDVIESSSPNQISAVIKSHHNVGGLPKDLGLKLLEPVRSLFKDEVRLLGRTLNIPEKLLNRHPFPGPGLAIRIIGEAAKEDLDLLRNVDDIFIQELKNQNQYHKIWQAFCVLLPCRSVGVQGDRRTFEKTIVIRAVDSKDGMTADWHSFDAVFLKNISNKITNNVQGVNRVVYDITSKPPGTIEWE